MNIHRRNVNDYLKKIASFEERKEMLLRIFGIFPDFRLLKAARECKTLSDWDEYVRQMGSFRDFKRRIPTAFSSYLTLSVGEGDILLQHEKGPNVVSYAVEQEIAPSSLQPLDDDKIALFASAIETLKLDGAHTYIMADDRDEDEWPWSGSEDDAEALSDDDGGDTLQSAKPAKKQHVECLDCGTAVCKGQQTLSKKEPELMLLEWGKLEAYDAEELGSGYFHVLS